MKRFIKLKEDKGFTLVELLIVMAIIAVLIGISIAGLGFAMRRSRNISRQSAMANLERALAAYYSDEQDYPGVSEDDPAETLPTMITGAAGSLNSYLEGSWEAPPQTDILYGYDSSNTTYVVCVSQEEAGSTMGFVCTGPGIGSAGFPTETSYDELATVAAFQGLSGITEMTNVACVGDDGAITATVCGS